MHLWVPEPGSSFRLTEDWSFTIKNAFYNRTLFKYLAIPVTKEWDGNSHFTSLPKDSIVKIVKYDIKVGRSQNNCLVLRLERCPKSPRKNGKIATFTLPLSEVNTAQIEVVEDVTRQYFQPVGKKDVAGEPFSFGEFNQLSKDTKNGAQFPYFVSFIDPYTKKLVETKLVLYRDRGSSPDNGCLQSRFTAHYMIPDTYAYVRFYLDEKIVSATMPLENIPARVIVPKSHRVFYLHSYEQAGDYKKTQITIHRTDWVDSGQAD